MYLKFDLSYFTDTQKWNNDCNIDLQWGSIPIIVHYYSKPSAVMTLGEKPSLTDSTRKDMVIECYDVDNNRIFSLGPSSYLKG
jgi:hypothetical protein